MAFVLSRASLPRSSGLVAAAASGAARPRGGRFGITGGLSAQGATAAAAIATCTAAAVRRRGARAPSSFSSSSSSFRFQAPALVARHASAIGAAEDFPSEILFRSDIGPKVELAEAWQNGGSLVLFLKGKPSGAKEDSGPLDLGQMGGVVDSALGGALRTVVDEEEFDGKAGSAKVCQVFGKDVKRVVLVGLGPSDKDVDWRLAGAAAAGALKGLKNGGAAAFAHVEGAAAQALVEGIYLGLHEDNRYKGSKTPDKEKAPTFPSALQLVGFPAGSTDAAVRARAVATGVIFARELVNGAPNKVTPPTLAAAAADLASKVGLTAKILDEAECEAMGMGSFLAVGKCSDLPSSLIHLTYTPPGGAATRKIGIVGKGLTFDSGGYNLKAGAGSMIEMMKFDMGGAAATLGAAAAVAQLKPEGVEVHFVIATCENMISGNPGALRPGDIITAMDGTTIEVNNTDAEGRLTLADAMLYCQQQGVSEVVDIATLTGACMVALGQDIAGMWSNSDELAGALETSAKATGEKLWRMPLEEGYWEGMKSDFADMKNTGPRFGGAITAALFLQKFVQKDIKWAHLDIAGTVWADKAKGINIAGGTGSMVRTLTDLVSKKA